MFPEQLTLSIQLEPQLTFENFVTGQNQELVEVCQTLTYPQPYLYLWGCDGVGKSHILQACCHQAIAANLTTFYLSLAHYQDYTPDMMIGLENVACLCLDDVDAIAGVANWQEALFHLFNKIMASGNRLVIAGACSPRELPLELADLTSRLSSGLIFHVNELSDTDKVIALQCQAENRGLSLADEVAQFILYHGDRDMSSLMQILQQLDDASLSTKRRLTIPFVKSVMHW